MECKGICTDLHHQVNNEENTTTSETENSWKPPPNSKLKKEVQTIIDIMGPKISSSFNYNTSSEADNEESIFTNSKLSTDNSLLKKKHQERCKCKNNKRNDESEKTADSAADIPSKEDDDDEDEANNIILSTADADFNSNTLNSATFEEDLLTDPKVNFPYTILDNNNIQYNICPPPLRPANICINSECMCPQVAAVLQQNNNGNCNCGIRQPKNAEIPQMQKIIKSDPKSLIFNWLKSTLLSKSCDNNNNECNNAEYYKMNVKRKRGEENSPPRRVVFELVNDADVKIKESGNTICDSFENIMDGNVKTKKNVKNERLQTKADHQSACKKFSSSSQEMRKSARNFEKTFQCDSSGTTRVDVYYFDHGSFNHYQTTDAPPLVTTEEVADKTEKYTTRFWAEIFGTIHIGFSFATAFLLQFFRFILYSLVRPLTIGFLQLGSDYFLKPLLATLFNGILQPILIFIYNIFSSLRDICDPISDGIGYFIREFAVLIKSFRIVEITKENTYGNKCGSSRKFKEVC